MNMNKDLPIYKYELEEDLAGLFAISIVDKPAIQINLLSMSEDKTKDILKMEMSDDEKRIITGPIAVPDLLVYRNDSVRGEHLGYFSEIDIRTMAEEFFKNGFNLNITYQHDGLVSDIYLFESWVIEDENNDKANFLGFTDLPKGTHMVSMKVDNEEVWEVIKSEDTGFSIEAEIGRKLIEGTVGDCTDGTCSIKDDEDIDETVMSILTQAKDEKEIITDLIKWLEID